MRIWRCESAVSWRELSWPRPLSSQDALACLRALADDPLAPMVVLELRANGDGHCAHYLLGADPGQVDRVLRLLGVPGSPVDCGRARPAVMTARELTVALMDRPLDAQSLPESAALILKALNRADGPGEQLVLQLVLGPRLRAAAADGRPGVGFSWERLRFVEQPLDAATRAARSAKTGLPGFRCVARVGAAAGSTTRRRDLMLGMLGALRRLETPGQRLGYRPVNPARLGMGASVALPLHWRLRLNAGEIAALGALPVGGGEYPGLPAPHPRLLAAERSARVDAEHALAAYSTAPASLDAPLVRSTDALLHHLHVLGPTGTGKSVALLNLALQDIRAGRAVAVIEPKGDLVEDLLARMPEGREQDVVVFDPLDGAGVVGLNPLAGPGSPELRAQRVYAIFQDLFADSLGVRTADLLHAGLLTLSRRPDASLVQLPLLFSDPRFRNRLVAPVMDDLALGPFWAWYANLRDAERAGVVAPLMNKLRALILNPVIRRVIGQPDPRFQLGQVFRERRILLAALPADRLGEQGAGLLGSLLIGQLWQAAGARAGLPAASRRPAAVYVDEAQRFLHLGTSLSDVLAMSRSYGVGWTLAHQYLNQLPAELRSAVLANCRSRIAFQSSREDGETLAKLSGGLLMPEDFTSLPAHHAYISLYGEGRAQPYASGRTLPAPKAASDPMRLRARSARAYGRPAAEIEAAFRAWQSAEEGEINAKTERIGARRRTFQKGIKK